MSGVYACRFDLIDHKKFNLTIHTATLEFMLVTTLQTTGGLRAHAHRDQSYLLPRVEAGGWNCEHNGKQYSLGPGQGLLVSPDVDDRSELAGGVFRSTSIGIPAKLIHSEACALIGEPITRPLEITAVLHMGSTYLAEQIDYLLEQLSDPQGIFDKHPHLARKHQRMLMQTLIETPPNNYQERLGRDWGGRARRIVAQLEDYYQANLADATVGSASEALRLNAGTLKNACLRMGLPKPHELLHRMRLHEARRRLEHPRPGESVASIAHDVGFSNATRFRGDYRKTFQNERAETTLDRGCQREGCERDGATGACLPSSGRPRSPC
jgi:AraC-like DNA-binding protein